MTDKLEGLTVFLTVAETRSFRVASERLGITRSAVSQAFQRLEDRLGVALAQRTTRSVHLTEAGERLYAAARPAVEDLWGSGAVIDALLEKAPRATASPEAKVARTASRAVRHDLPEQLAACASGMELVEKGFPADVAIAAELDVSAVVPVLTNGWFSAVE